MRLQTCRRHASIMASSPFMDDDMKKRAIVVALGTGLVISSATALDIGVRAAAPIASQHDVVQVARTREAARTAQREQIQARFVAEREQCAQLRGYQREKCVVRAQANRGRALLDAAAPYEVRF
jgi:hypothetical protein